MVKEGDLFVEAEDVEDYGGLNDYLRRRSVKAK